jgi:hypothetical protein
MCLIHVQISFLFHVLFVPNDENVYADYVNIQLKVLFDEMYQYDLEVNQESPNLYPK